MLTLYCVSVSTSSVVPCRRSADAVLPSCHCQVPLLPPVNTAPSIVALSCCGASVCCIHCRQWLSGNGGQDSSRPLSPSSTALLSGRVHLCVLLSSYPLSSHLCSTTSTDHKTQVEPGISIHCTDWSLGCPLLHVRAFSKC